MIKIELDWLGIPPNGYALYKTSAYKHTKLYCKWYLYPIFATLNFLIRKRTHLYHFLNDKGIMYTPNANIMVFSDLWRKQPCK